MDIKLTKDELLNMIEDRGDLQIVLVADVIQSGYTEPYKFIIHSNEQLEADTKLYGLHIVDKKYMLLTAEEIYIVNKKGYIPDN